MGEQRLIWTGDGLQFDGITGYGDAVRIGGEPDRRGAKPSDLVPIALAACTAYDVVTILRKQRQDLRGMEVVLTTTQDPEPPWTFRAIHQHFVFTGDVDDRKAARAIVLAETKHCAVAATIRTVVELSHSHEVVPV
jgi:putative redox protein